MKLQSEKDYAKSGLSIRTAMIDHFKRFPDERVRPDHILWDGRRVTTGDVILVPQDGFVMGEFIFAKGQVEQGFDLKVDGWIQLAQNERVPLLRTWNDPCLEPRVEYPFHSNDNRLRVWNVYKMRYAGGQVVEERWTENAGMWVEEVSPTERIYHCSHGMADPPDFECLVFKVTIK